jgi:GntR family transcriptional regulator/MocR family aminotransferase
MLNACGATGTEARLVYRCQAAKWAATRRAAGRLQVDVPDQGMHLVAYLESGTSDVAVEVAAQRAGIVVRAISRFYRAASPRPGLMLGFSGFPRQLIVPAAARLAAVVTG